MTRKTAVAIRKPGKRTNGYRKPPCGNGWGKFVRMVRALSGRKAARFGMIAGAGRFASARYLRNAPPG